MRLDILFLLMIAILGLNSCSTSKKGRAILIKSTPENKRMWKFFEKNMNLEYKGDNLAVKAILSIPEIEVPHREKLSKKYKLGFAPDTKVGEAIHVYNNQVCMQIFIISKNKTNYPNNTWNFDVKIDKKRVKTHITIKDDKIYNFDAGESLVISGQKNIRICTIEKFPKVAQVLLSFRRSSGGIITNFEWSAPWPKLDVN